MPSNSGLSPIGLLSLLILRLRDAAVCGPRVVDPDSARPRASKASAEISLVHRAAGATTISHLITHRYHCKDFDNAFATMGRMSSRS
jgi:hypothetical protein